MAACSSPPVLNFFHLYERGLPQAQVSEAPSVHLSDLFPEKLIFFIHRIAKHINKYRYINNLKSIFAVAYNSSSPDSADLNESVSIFSDWSVNNG